MTDKELMQLALEALDIEMPVGAYFELRNALRERLSQPEQKHTGFIDSKINPIQREWVGLTDGELIALSESGLALWELWKAIEAKLKEKNGG